MNRSAALCALLVLVVLCLPAVAAPPVPVSFNRQIRPLLAERCFLCHGPDAGTRKAGLRLDQREVALQRGALVPGNPARSKLIARVFAPSAALRMPPAASHSKPLAAAEKDLLKRWVAQGAPYEKHWAFLPLPAKVALPPVKDAAWCRSPLDRFVKARLEREGLKPSREAARADWLRRATLDLTGLPPSLSEIDGFLADRTPGAYERVVDRLLSSPRYGERMAQAWLDLARYADSYGYQSDQLCPTWPYRDWVVQAFNQNLSYDRFVTWQLAGDLLPGATRTQRLATAFNRLHRMTNEGGSVAEEWRMEGVADRVSTFGTTFLGLTTGCARCHDHKYDPLTQKDFYATAAFFNSIDEYGLYNQSDIVPTPSLLLPTRAQEEALSRANEGVRQAEQAQARARAGREEAFRAWRAGPKAPALSDLSGLFDFDAFESDGSTLRNRAPGASQNGSRSEEVPLVEGHAGKAAQLDGENNVQFPGLGSFTRHTPFTIAFWLRDPRRVEDSAVVFHASSGTDVGFHGYDLRIEKGVLTARMYRHWPGNAIAVRAKREVKRDAWTHIALTYDGSSRAAGLRLYLDGEPAPTEVLRDRLYKGTGAHTLAFGQRFRDRGLAGARLDDLAIFTRDLTPLEIGQLFDGRRLSDRLARAGGPDEPMRDYYFSAIDPDTRAASKALAAARQQVGAAEDPQQEVAVMEEIPSPRPAFVLARGRYDAPKTDANRVGRATPAFLPPSHAADRLALARWLLRPDHPLTARVAVNRLWALLFGRGIVETVEDFGIQGRFPTHPELLDYLARDFIDGGWDTKAFLKKVVLSATYRQASSLRPDLRARDPQNLLLARGPSYRLSAETIRDTALFASGLLDTRMGGPPVSPYQPGDLWREANTMSPAYRQSVGGDLYRRSLYSVVKRTAPLPNLMAFDGVSREVCIARRSSTNTPLQAFVLLNDPQFVEAARALGEKMLKEGGATDAERVRFAFRALATREPAAEESRLLGELYAGQRDAFALDPEAAKRWIAVGESKADPGLAPAELAAAAAVAQAILNLDATIWKR